jgi:hypothetical protein
LVQAEQQQLTDKIVVLQTSLLLEGVLEETMEIQQELQDFLVEVVAVADFVKQLLHPRAVLGHTVKVTQAELVEL